MCSKSVDIKVPLLIFIVLTAVSEYSFSYENDYDIDLETAVTPTRTEIPVIDSPVSITKLDVTNLSLLGLKEFEDYFRLVPGFRVTSYQGHSPQISYHGTQGSIPRRMEALLDGQSIYRSGYARVHWGRLPLDEQDLNYIEVARGPSVSDYGSNSFLSAVNLISRQPQIDYGHYLEFTSGSHDKNNVFLRSGSENNGAFSSWRFFYQSDEGFDSDSDGAEANDGKRNASAFFHRRYEKGSSAVETKFIVGASDYDIHIREADTLTNEILSEELNFFFGTKYTLPFNDNQETLELSFNISNYQREQDLDRCIWSGLFLDELKAVDKSPNLDVTDLVFALEGVITSITPEVLSDPVQLLQIVSQTEIPIDFSQLELSDYLALGRLAARIVQEGDNVLEPVCGITNQDVNETVGEVDALFKSFGNSWVNTFGIKFRAMKVESETYLGGSVNAKDLMVSDHLRYEFGRNWIFNTGFMAEFSELEEITFSPRASLTFKPVPNHGIRLGYSQAERTPDIYETERYWIETYNFYGDYRDLDGRKVSSLSKVSTTENKLEPEKIVEIDLGYYAKLYSVPITYDLKIFKSELTRLISEPIIYTDFELSNENKLTLSGFEGQLEYNNAPMTIGMVYSYLDSETTQILEESLYSKHAGAVYGIYKFPNELSFGLAHYSNSKLASSSYDRSDITVTKDLVFSKSRMRFQGNLRYMTNMISNYNESTPGTTSSYGYDDSISVYLTLTANFY